MYREDIRVHITHLRLIFMQPILNAYCIPGIRSPGQLGPSLGRQGDTPAEVSMLSLP